MLLAVPSVTSEPRWPWTLATMPSRKSDELALCPSSSTAASVSSNLIALMMTLPKPEIAPCAKIPVPPVPGKPAMLIVPPPPQPAVTAEAASTIQLRRVRLAGSFSDLLMMLYSS